MDLSKIEKAQKTIRPHVHRTPLVFSNNLSRLTGSEVYLKLENLQVTGSYKVRGAFNKILASGAKKVIAASMGNHAQGVAYAAAALGARARIVMPANVSAVKEEAVRAYGADVVLHGESLAQAVEFAADQKDWLFIHPYDDYDVIAGQGTIALEIARQMGDRGLKLKPDIIVVPVGGGGLAAGIGAAVKKSLFPEAEIVGVQSDAALSALLSYEAKMPVSKEIISHTLADGIAVSSVGEKTLPLLLEYLSGIFSVDDGFIAKAVFLLMERKKIVAEGAGATPLALLLKDPGRFRGKRTVLVISGGNVDFTLLDRIVRLGLADSGRVGAFCLEIDDIPGALNHVTGLLARKRANILDIRHERYRGGGRVYRTMVEFVIEARNRRHFEEILDETNGKEVKTGCNEIAAHKEVQTC